MDIWTCYMIPNNSFYNWISWCLIEGELLYNTVLVSAKHQHESAIGIPMSPALEPPCHHPSRPTPQSCYRKIWKASQICVSSLGRGHANLLSVIPICHYMCYQSKHTNNKWRNVMETCIISFRKWITSPALIQDPWGWCTGMTRRDGTGREVGGRFRMGNTCLPVVDSCWCVAEPI